LAIFGARIAESAPTLPLPSRSRKRPNERSPASAPHQRSPADLVRAPHRHEGSDVARLERGKCRKRHPCAPVLGEERQALPHVAGIGLERLRRQPPLGAQMRQPTRHLLRHRRIGAVECERCNGLIGPGHLKGYWRCDSPDYIALPSFTVR
jgi:hypothetical protein